MSWDAARAEQRIRQHLKTVPEVAVGTVLAKRFRLQEVAAGPSGKFPNGRATLIEGVHMYGHLLDFEDVVSESGYETEASHKRVLQFLDVHYRVWDSILEDDSAIRVDYHGPRLHTVITQPEGDAAEQIARAIALAFKLGQAAEQVGSAFGFPSRVRFGIDWGQCLAMGTGRAHEKDILFLGSPANHAAKIAAAENEPGIVLTDNAKEKLATSASRASFGKLVTKDQALQEVQHYRFDRIGAAASAIANADGNLAKFEFRRISPPLAALNFRELMPSNTVRMGMASLFADIDGFTAYVDKAISGGESAIATAVRDLHVLREELNSVLKGDFGGKRVRFIGDCIQGVIAEGKRADDPSAAVSQSVYCASGMRSSFTLAKQILGTIEDLDLAIGVEYGDVPLTRIGNRGDGSVRCAAGLAIIQSEYLQQSIEGGGLKLGTRAQNFVPPDMQAYFKSTVTLMEYADASDYFGFSASPVVQIMRNDPSARPHAVSVAKKWK